MSSASAEPCPRLDGLPGRDAPGRAAGRRGAHARLADEGPGEARRDAGDAALHIPRCRSVHTFTMRFPLDLIWLDKAGRGRADRPERPAAPAEELPARALGDRGQRRHGGLASSPPGSPPSLGPGPTPRFGPGTHAAARVQGYRLGMVRIVLVVAAVVVGFVLVQAALGRGRRGRGPAPEVSTAGRADGVPASCSPHSPTRPQILASAARCPGLGVDPPIAGKLGRRRGAVRADARRSPTSAAAASCARSAATSAATSPR